jgi:hypothetical protein
MSSHHSKQHLKTSPKNSQSKATSAWRIIVSWFFPGGLPNRRWARRLLLGFVSFLVLIAGGMYGVAEWYIHSQPNTPRVVGVSFIPDYARYLGVEPHETLQSLLHIGVRHLRLVSYWSDIEPVQGRYNFDELDSEMQQAQAVGAKVTLSVGLRQPRYPECHAPNWIDTSQSESNWVPQLNNYMSVVITRYKDNPALQSYQLENEFFNHFGACTNFDRTRLDSELALVHKLDSKHPVIITRSNNYAGFSTRAPLPDQIGVSVYRRVWDSTLTHRYLQYPFPSWYYAFLAGTQQILTGKPSILHELQTEPWLPNGKDILSTSLTEQNKSFDAARLAGTVKFARNTGMKQIDLWGGEYWYYRMTVLHDPTVWNEAKNVFAQPPSQQR